MVWDSSHTLGQNLVQKTCSSIVGIPDLLQRIFIVGDADGCDFIHTLVEVMDQWYSYKSPQIVNQMVISLLKRLAVHSYWPCHYHHREL